MHDVLVYALAPESRKSKTKFYTGFQSKIRGALYMCARYTCVRAIHVCALYSNKYDNCPFSVKKHECYQTNESSFMKIRTIS